MFYTKISKMQPSSREVDFRPSLTGLIMVFKMYIHIDLFVHRQQTLSIYCIL